MMACFCLGRIALGASLALASTPDLARGATPAEAIYGEWVSDCVPLGQNGRHGLVLRLHVSSRGFEAAGQMFARNSCDVPVIASRYMAEVQSLSGTSGTLQFNLRFRNATMTINDEEVAAMYERGGGCGLKGWRLNVPMHVEGRTCMPISYPQSDAPLVLDASLSRGRLKLHNLSALFGSNAAPGVVIPGDLEFARRPG